MICNTCGRNTLNEDANFCEYCGSPFREQAQNIYPINSQAEAQIKQDTSEKPISFSNWLVLNFILFGSLLFSPIGPIVAMAVLAGFSFSSKVSENKKNWARATLVSYMVYFIITLAMMFIMLPLLKEFMNGSVDFNSLSQSVSPK